MSKRKTIIMDEYQSLEADDKVIPTGKQFSRRDFLKVSGSGIFIFFATGAFSAIELQQRRRDYPTDFNAYLKIGNDGRVSLFCSKIEMGQGIYTSMAQMLAEELDVAIDSIDMVMGDTMFCPWDSGTTGSRSTKNYGPPLRKAGAKARAILLQMASEQLKVKPERLLVKNGVINDKVNAASKVTYAELVAGKQIDRHIADVPIKAIAEHTVSGKPTMRRDALPKVTGEAKFAADIILPGMLHAKVLRPPTHDATLVSVDVTKAKSFTGAIVIHEENLIAVLHEKPDLAADALALVSAKWDVPDPKVDNRSVFDFLIKAAPDGRVNSDSYLQTIGCDILEGRNFLADSENDIAESIIVNQNFVKTFDLEDALNQAVYVDKKPYHIVGIVEDFVNYNGNGENNPDKIGPEINIRWEPSQLRYGYLPDNLVKIIN